MNLFTGVFIIWGVTFSTCILVKSLRSNKHKVEYFDLTDRVIKNKRIKSNINEKVKGIFNK